MKKDYILMIFILIIALYIDNANHKTKSVTKSEMKKVELKEDVKPIAIHNETISKPIIKKVQEPKEKFSKTKSFIEKKRAEWK